LPLKASPIPVKATALTVSVNDFRLAMRKLAASVNVITTAHDGAQAGLTATSVCSVSFEPLTMLACINREASSFPLFEKAGKMAISLLSVDDLAIAKQFSRHDNTGIRFSTGAWKTMDGMPVLESAAARISLTITSHHDSGTHRVYFGTVTAVEINDETPTLIYENGRFCRVANFS